MLIASSEARQITRHRKPFPQCLRKHSKFWARQDHTETKRQAKPNRSLETMPLLCMMSITLPDHGILMPCKAINVEKAQKHRRNLVTSLQNVREEFKKVSKEVPRWRSDLGVLASREEAIARTQQHTLFKHCDRNRAKHHWYLAVMSPSQRP